ncbi:pyridoxal-phosphate dependent enzyme [Legionella oakridgensis]|uniref:L-serine ammonia-lyase n=2 Tax=Legionella oakridgensis TaxID=29423 RepID=W0BC88_9GAMM|nr:pyridoxal-phosphate dependent enzyme [Legionella oakridgensis]AHE66281.1 threonine dehydratase [Legionella oakridgensis ATCC 33761 = DSM 21215]KTD37224.1 Phenylserine dehydratase [Legionella oakridgensis]STY16176.1 Phenylserine dehydratase [Legionella longbeachae]
MQPLHIKTPLISSQHLHNTLGKNIYFKLELLQPTGSFKLRGIGKLCQREVRRGRRSFVASSGGNAGVAVAYCGMKLGVSTTIFIPSSSHPMYIDAIKSYGAQVIVAGAVWDEAHQAAEIFAKNNKAAYIPPFDHPMLWDGHATMIEEVITQGLEPPDAVIVSVGGGGLACGVLEGMRRYGWNHVPLIAVETTGADSFFQSVNANRHITLPSITSKATSLGAKHVSERLLQWTNEHTIKNIVVSDQEAELGSRAFAKEQRMLVELSSGASLFPVYENHSIIHPLKSILVIVCGGMNISHFNL